jgi:hypothetical protein
LQAADQSAIVLAAILNQKKTKASRQQIRREAFYYKHWKSEIFSVKPQTE